MSTHRIAWIALAATAMGLSVAAPAAAQTKEELSEKLDQAHSRIQDLEGQVRDLLDRMKQVENAPARQGQDRAQLQRLLEEMGQRADGDPVWKSQYRDLVLQLYGYIKVDASYTTAKTNDVDMTLFVRPEGSGTTNDDEFGITANSSRLGLKVQSPYPILGGEALGVFEIDFFGGGPENKANPMMRKAYMEVFWPESDTKLLAGQTFEPLSPLNPDTLNYPVLWLAGNIGYRRPMLMLTKGLPLGEWTKLTLQGAVLRHTALGGDTGTLDGINEADDAGWPLLEGRAGLTLPALVSGESATVGVSGHYGEDEVDLQPGRERHFPTWSVAGDVTLPLTAWLCAKGEVFVGDNLDAFLGGIGQGVDLGRNTEIRSVGGWGQLTLYPGVLLALPEKAKDFWCNFGYGVDDPNNGDLSAGRRARNESLYANIKFKLSPQLTIGAELSYWETDYKDSNDGESVRFQTSVIYSF